MYYPYSENKGTDQLDLRLCYHICKSRFSHNEAHIKLLYRFDLFFFVVTYLAFSLMLIGFKFAISQFKEG